MLEEAWLLGGALLAACLADDSPTGARDAALIAVLDSCGLRRKLRGRVFKGRKVTGDEAEWVVLEPVHRAVEVLLEFNDDPGHLFGHYGGKKAGRRKAPHQPIHEPGATP
ncbi:hypothetical protein ACBJ59_54555 [Nonomuraea sp. MTCD27]|uniref:hypothetical protein n=1 Tax=Nonomuraea sp. MTCD27 TaxID=1676747 RepID=UPI0035C07E2F